MRKFGIEIEVGLRPGSRKSDVENALAAEGLGGQAHGYVGHSDRFWVVKTDASVPNGVEVVSPPLDFDNAEQREQLTRAIKAMQPHCKPVSEGGIHVHIESSSLTPQQVAAVGRCFAHFEDVLYRLASSGWQTIRAGARSYARPLSPAQKQGLGRARTEPQVRRAYYGYEGGARGHGDSSRYCGLNLHSHFYRGTIEFRLFNGSLNPTRVQTYVAIAMALVQDARNGHARSMAKAVPLGSMAAGRADAAKAFFRFQQIVRYYGDMDINDFKSLKTLWKDSRAQLPM